MNTRTINLLISKLKVCKYGYDWAIERKDYVEASKFREAFYNTKERINGLKKVL